MNWLFEDPKYLLIAMGLTFALGVMFWFTTGPGWLWRPMLGLVVLAVLVIIVEQLVVTDREQIEEIISRGAEAFRRGDVAGVETLLDPGAFQLRRDVQTAMAEGRISELRITDQKIRVDRKQQPPSAEVDLIVRGKASERNGPIQDFMLGLTITLEEPGQAWLINSARVGDVVEMLKGKRQRPSASPH